MLVRCLNIFLFSCLIMLLNACGNHTYHVVKPGDTLYSIGWAYGYDYKNIAVWNDIEKPYAIQNGQIIKFKPGDTRLSSKLSSQTSSRQIASNKVIDVSASADKHKPNQSKKKNSINKNHSKKIAWKWPTISKNIVQYFSESDIRRKGLNIAGRNGQSISAAAAGRVVYSGSGLIGYGKLIIIKHSESFLSAYAHNRELLVKEGEQIKAGHRIATMGSSGTDKVMLHFEIRHDGKPVNPLDYLPRRG